MKPNLLFIVLDTLRADHTSVHGYERETTPCLEALADDGYAFDHAFAAAPWTPPSHASMFSGVYPSSHGYLDSGMSFEPPHRSLAELLRDEGYSTFGAVRNAHIDSQQEVTRGFQEYGDVYRFPIFPKSISDLKSHYYALAPGYARVALRTIRADRRPSEYVTCEYVRKRMMNRKNPFFGFVNINSPHSPYAPPKPYQREFETFDRDGVDMDLIKSLSYITDQGGHRFIAGELEASQGSWDAVKDWYDGEVRFSDELVNKLVSTLKREGVYDDTMIVVVGDHGEHFGEHGRATHQFSLFDELLHVPMVIKPPEVTERDRDATEKLVSLVDVYPTILRELGISVPDSVHGQDIFGPSTNDVIFAEYGSPERQISNVEGSIDGPLDREIRDELNTPLQCARTATHKYIRKLNGGDEVYEITGGVPKESVVPRSDHQELGQLIREELNEDLSVGNYSDFDEKRRKNLKQLGYL